MLRRKIGAHLCHCGHGFIPTALRQLLDVGDDPVDVKPAVLPLGNPTPPKGQPTGQAAGQLAGQPTGQAALVDRIEHSFWKALQAPHAPGVGFLAAVIGGLAQPVTTIRAVLVAAGLGSVDPATRGVLAVPLYAFDTVTRSQVAPELPVM